jgi:hypothetical protein
MENVSMAHMGSAVPLNHRIRMLNMSNCIVSCCNRDGETSESFSKSSGQEGRVCDLLEPDNCGGHYQAQGVTASTCQVQMRQALLREVVERRIFTYKILANSGYMR